MSALARILIPMKIRLSELRRLIRNVIAESGQAPPNAPLGQYAFPSKRASENLPDEPDTQLEEELFEKLMMHFQTGKSRSLKPADADMLRGFLEAGHYASVFHPPEVAEVYRGMKFSPENLHELENILGLENFNLKAGIGVKGGEKKVDIILSPHGGAGASSWTDDFDTAKDFSFPDDLFTHGAVFVAKVSDNPNQLISCPGGLYKLSQIDMYHREKEVIALGDIRVHKVIWGDQESYF